MQAFSSSRSSFNSRKFILPALILFAFFLSGCQTARHASRSRILPSPEAFRSQQTQNRVNGILKTAFSQVGNRYRYGGSTPETGFDCSGFVSWVYKQYGVNLPRSSRDMLGVGTPVERAELRPGDLVFFNYGYSHVGIYTGDNKYIHSPSSGKLVQESNLNGRGRSNHYVAARRIIDNAGVTNISERLKTEWIQASRHQTALALNDRTAQRHTGANAAYQAPTPKKSRTAARKKGATTTVAAKKSAGTHKVASGDTLVDVARRYGVSASDIVAFNRLPNANKIKPGQTLQIPTPNKKAAVSPKKKASVASKKKSAARKAPAKRAKAPTTRKKS